MRVVDNGAALPLIGFKTSERLKNVACMAANGSPALTAEVWLNWNNATRDVAHNLE